jgi:hypothetical protein
VPPTPPRTDMLFKGVVIGLALALLFLLTLYVSGAKHF